MCQRHASNETANKRVSGIAGEKKTLYHSYRDRNATFFFTIVRTAVIFCGHGRCIFFFSLICPEWGHWILSKTSAESCFFLFVLVVSVVESFVFRFSLGFAVGRLGSQNVNFMLSKALCWVQAKRFVLENCNSSVETKSAECLYL